MTTASRVDPVLADFLGRIDGVRSGIERLILFGPRARGEHRPDSDYDVLVVVTRRDDALVDALYDAVMECSSPPAR